MGARGEGGMRKIHVCCFPTHLERGSSVLEQLLACAAKWAGGLGEDHDGVLVDEGLGLILCGSHDDWTWRES